MRVPSFATRYLPHSSNELVKRYPQGDKKVYLSLTERNPNHIFGEIRLVIHNLQSFHARFFGTQNHTNDHVQRERYLDYIILEGNEFSKYQQSSQNIQLRIIPHR